MGDSSGSMMYLFGIVIVIYIVGMGIYTCVQKLRKRQEEKRSQERFGGEGK